MRASSERFSFFLLQQLSSEAKDVAEGAEPVDSMALNWIRIDGEEHKDGYRWAPKKVFDGNYDLVVRSDCPVSFPRMASRCRVCPC